MADLREVLEWLRLRIPHEYVDPQRVYSEVAGTLQSNPLIRPRTNIFVHEDGRSELLLCIEGLLPIHYRNNNYKIPVAIWIPQDYPQSPPMVFVTPKKDMIVKQSRNVDPNGKCYHPNLANWSSDPNVRKSILPTSL
jgi:ESCRT-I complex subunit TSG101